MEEIGEAAVPSDTKKFDKGNNSLITRCGPQTGTKAFLCCCDWDKAVQAARTGGVHGSRGVGIDRSSAALQALGSQEPATTAPQRPWQ